MGFGCTYYYVLGVPYSCGWREIGSFFVVAGKFYYNRKKVVLVVCVAGCAVVSVFGSGDYDRKKIKF